MLMSMPYLEGLPLGFGHSDARRHTAQCPVRHSGPAPRSQSFAKYPISNEQVDPRNKMSVESQEPAPSQPCHLPTIREISSIPRPPDSTRSHQTNTQANWEYPSPQQFYDALRRKGFDIPESRIEDMVLLHNKLNEDAWKEVLRWESRFHGRDTEVLRLELASFSGIRGRLSNKARLYQFGRQFFPSYFTLPDPFDRYDWIVHRPRTGKKARYVIDYYGMKHPRRETNLVVDARPALDSLDNARMRFLALIGRMLSILGAAIGDSHAARGSLVKYCVCLLAVGISVYLSRTVLVI